MPHVPWQFLPDGRRYRKPPNDAVPGMSNQSYNDQGQLDVLLQRHFLQTGFADLELQELWRHLKREGMWDESLIVVAADHGVAFVKGRRDRRTLDGKNYGEIAPIPLFIKAPGQEQGRVNDAYVETIDILPTIFDLLHLKPKVKMDGHSAFSPDGAEPADSLRILQRNTFKPMHFPVAGLRGGQEAGPRAQPPAVRHRRGRPRAHLPDRPAPGAARPARARGRGQGLGGDRGRGRLRERESALGLRAHPPGGPAERRNPGTGHRRGGERPHRGGGEHLHAGPGRGRRVLLGDDPGVVPATAGATASTCSRCRRADRSRASAGSEPPHPRGHAIRGRRGRTRRRPGRRRSRP